MPSFYPSLTLFVKKSKEKRHPQFVICHSMKFHTSGAAGLKSGQFNRERNFGLVLQINVFILVLKSEYRIMNIECRKSKEGILSIFIN